LVNKGLEVVISNITIDASCALFTDTEAYKDRMNAFVDEKTTLIKKFIIGISLTN
jgi:hypothetical protein